MTKTAVLWVAIGCGGAQKQEPPPRPVAQKPPPPDAKVEAPADLLAQGQAALRNKDYAKAKKSLGELEQRYGSSAEAKAGRRPYVDACLGAGEYRDAVEGLRVILRDADGETRRQAIADLASAGAKAGDGLAVLQASAEMIPLAGSATERSTLEQRVLSAIDHDVKGQDLDRMIELAKNTASLSFAYDALLMKSAKVALHVGDFARAKSVAGEIVSRNKTPSYVSVAQEMVQKLSELGTVKARAIGVLLPLSGEKAPFGKSALSAIKLAFDVPNDSTSSPNGIELVIKDTVNDPDKAQRAVDELATQDHVIAVLGPMFSEESLAAAVRAESYGLPMINLSRRDGIPQIGPNVFRLCLTPKQQAQAIAKLVFDVLGYKRFAVLYPNIAVGAELANLFWDEVEAHNGEIRGIESFNYDETTFMTPIKKLVGRYNPEARSDYYQALREMQQDKSMKGIKRQRAHEQILKSLPPITDFDAIFIPANAKQVGYIAPALAFEDIILTTDPRELKKIEKTTGREHLQPIKLIGTNSWNNPQTAERGGKYVEGAIFVDGFFAQDGEQNVQKFVRAFMDENRREPALPDAQAYDAAGLLREALGKNPADRAALQKALQATKDFSGVTGKISFDGDGEAQKDLFYLTIEKGSIVRFEPKRPEAG